MDIHNKKLLFADLDGTLIKTASGKTFPEDITDFRIRLDVLNKIKQLPNIKYVGIVTNQGGIPQYVKRSEFEAKLETIGFFLEKYVNRITLTRYCGSVNQWDPDRKPNTGMLESASYVVRNDIKDKSEMLMIGDASGKPGNFSGSDKKTAENFGIDYLDVEDFVNLHI